MPPRTQRSQRKVKSKRETAVFNREWTLMDAKVLIDYCLLISDNYVESAAARFSQEFPTSRDFAVLRLRGRDGVFRERVLRFFEV